MSGLPFLPGCTTDRTLGQTNFHKSQALSQRNGVSIIDQSKPGIGGVAIAGQTGVISTETERLTDGMPAWHSFRNKVLKFTAYFQEAVVESHIEQFRVRECTILFYLEDDTIQINEKSTFNSGMPQGTLVKRSRILRSGELTSTFEEAPTEGWFGIMDFNVGDEVTIYSRTFKITDCDGFTRDFLTQMGIIVGEPSEVPVDPHSELVATARKSLRAGRPYERTDTLGKFLEHDGQVLRFWCVWDDSAAEHGDKRHMVLHYFLADDTIEIKELLPPNSGRDKAGSFFGRNKLPKDVKALSKFPGASAPRVVLNTLGPAVGKNRAILDSTRMGDKTQDDYSDADLQIGNTILVLGRPMLLVDCDGFTRDYYSSKYGLSDFTPIDVSEPAPAAAPRVVPPPTGFGTDDDSMVSVEKLVLTAPKKRRGKFMPANSTPADGSFTLRFLADMVSDDPVSIGREFIISYFLEDDTISVYEMPKHNSGISAGMFMQRGKHKFADDSRTVSLEDVLIGKTVELARFKFKVKDADDYAKNMLPQIFPDDPAAATSP